MKTSYLVIIYATPDEVASTSGLDGIPLSHSGMLDFATLSGVGLPTMTSSGRDALSPTPRAGTMIFNTTIDAVQVRTSVGWQTL